MSGTDFATIRDALKGLVISISSLGFAIWEDQRDVYVDAAKRAILKMNIVAPTSQGVDDLVTTYDNTQAQGQEMLDTWRGVRKFTWRIKCESYSQEGGETAVAYLEQIRNRLPRQSSLAALRAVKVALISAFDVQDLSDYRDDHRTSIAVLDLRMRLAISEDDPARYGYIATLGSTGNITHANGSTVANSIKPKP